MRKIPFAVLAFALSGAACSSDDTGTGSAGTDAGADTSVGASSDTGTPAQSDTTAGTEDTGGPPLETFSLAVGPFDVAPYEEDTLCVITRLGNPEELRVSRIENHIGDASHHYIIYRTSDTEEVNEPFSCFPFVDTMDPEAGSPLMITQVPEETLALPEGVAYTFEPNQMIRLELHYINLRDETVSLETSTTFVPIAEEDFEAEADFVFIGNPDINIRAGREATLGPTYFELPDELRGKEFFALTGHTHQWGTKMWVATTTGPDGADTLIYDPQPYYWDEPETAYYDPPVVVPSDGGFRFGCSWNNLSDERVSFGESANDEMCFFWAYYYPSDGALVCFHTDQFPGGIDVCCPGSPYCDLISDFFGD